MEMKSRVKFSSSDQFTVCMSSAYSSKWDSKRLCFMAAAGSTVGVKHNSIKKRDSSQNYNFLSSRVRDKLTRFKGGLISASGCLTAVVFIRGV